MTETEIKDIRENMRGNLDRLEELDALPEWGREEKREALLLLSELEHYASRQKSYYRQYRGLLRD